MQRGGAADLAATAAGLESPRVARCEGARLQAFGRRA